MVAELEEFTGWRISIEARIAGLDALYFSLYGYSPTLADRTARLIKLQSDQKEVLAGIATIIRPLNRERDGGGRKLS